LRQARGFTDYNAANNTCSIASGGSGIYNNSFTYDANGNILTQQRSNRTQQIENLTYPYWNDNGDPLQNRLYTVNETIASSVASDDIDDQGNFVNTSMVNGANNYIREIGELKLERNFIKCHISMALRLYDLIIFPIAGCPSSFSDNHCAITR
jgi:hypothetical protein